MQRDFYYIDAMPGAGKTEYFVKLAAKMLSEGARDEVLIYVAPTVDLIYETYCRLAERLKKPELMKKQTVVLVSGKYRRYFEALRDDIPKDQPATAMNFLLGLISKEDYLNVSYHHFNRHSLDRPIQLGQIIFVTHEAFVRTNRDDLTGGNFRILKKATVIFDEARRCVLQPNECTIEKDQMKQFFRAIDLTKESEAVPVDTNRRGPAERPWRLYRLDQHQDRTSEEIKELFKVKSASLLPRALKTVLDMHAEYVLTGRGEVFILSNFNLDDLTTSHTSKNVTFQIVMSPTSMFMHYKKVILTSAFFRDSQMYHLLKRDGHRMISVLQRKKLGPALTAIKERSERLLESTARRLHVAPLMTCQADSHGPNAVYQDTLTLSMLTNGMVISSKLDKKIRGRVDSDFTKINLLGRLVEKKPVTLSVELDQELYKYAVPPLWVLLSASAQLLKRWNAEFYPDSHKRSLLMINDREGTHEWVPNGVQFLRVVDTAISTGKLEDTTNDTNVSESDVASSRHAMNIRSTSKGWRRHLSAMLAHDRVDSTFTVPSSVQLHGLNKYANMRAFTHLAALNPSPTLIKIYNLLIPKYDVAQDHSIENLVQTLFRTALRNPELEGPVLMIVPYSSSVGMLAQKLKIDQLTCFESPRLAVLSTKGLATQSLAKKRSIRHSEANPNRKYDPKFDVRLIQASNRLKAAKAYLKRAKDVDRAQANVDLLQRRLDKLRAKAQLKKGK